MLSCLVHNLIVSSYFVLVDFLNREKFELHSI